MDNNSNNRDFTFLDFKGSRGGNRKINGEYPYWACASRHINENRSNSYRTAFSREVSLLVARKGLTHMRIRRDNLTGVMHVIFLKDTTGQCAPIGWDKTKGKNNIVRLYNKALCDFFATLAGKSGNFEPTYWQLSEDLSNSLEYATFRIIKHIEY